MKRDTQQLDGREFDVLVIGGGIYGAWTAYDAALRGLSVAIVDKGDWAAGTSSASTKLIHGGLRYLEQLRFGLVRRSLKERELLLRLAPHAVRPLRFIIPDYPDNRVARWKLRAGLAIYDLLAGGGTGSGGIGQADMASNHAFLAQENLRGGLLYNDCQMDDARLVVEIIDGASSAGAVAANYVQAVDFLRATGGVYGAVVRDQIGGRDIEIRARAVVNAAGPWAEALGGSPQRLIKGVHLVMPALPTDDAYLFMTRRDERVFFLVPWYGRTLLGTTDTDFDGNADDVRVDRADVDYLLTEAARYLGKGAWTEAEIHGQFAGVRALQESESRDPAGVTREWRVSQPERGLFVSHGGKYTSARFDAAHLVDHVMAHLKKSAASSTAARPFPWCPNGSYDEWIASTIANGAELGLSPIVAGVLAQRYGSRVTTVLDRIARDAALATQITPDLPFVRAEIATAIDEEMAVTLEDIVRRRIPLAILTNVGDAELRSIAGVLAAHLLTPPETLESQIESVLDRWARPINA
jgi:glycerol-3-phosphate dehydrogenase